MDRAVCLSTSASPESSGYGIPAGTSATWISESRVDQPADESWKQIGGQQAMLNPMFHGDRAPQRHVEAYQQVPDPQPPHRQDADAYWADKIAEVMRDQFGIKPKVTLIGRCILLHMI